MKKQNDFPIPVRELCERYEALYTAAVNDVLREMGIINCTLPHNIMPLKDCMKVCGIAFTICGKKDKTPEGEMEKRADMLEALGENSVAVWETNGDDESAQWGEIMTRAAVLRGCRGAVVDGGVRDTDRVLSQNFPVFCRYRSSNGMLGRFRMTDYQVPVTVGQITIRPGDVIFGDIDGVVVIARELAYDVLVRAEHIGEEEAEIKRQVDSGVSPSEIVAAGGYF